jgi:hypothetical protein
MSTQSRKYELKTRVESQRETRALIRLALHFWTWRRLSRESWPARFGRF